MRYKCPHCGHPKLCGRRYKEGFFGRKLVDNPISDNCYMCGTKWEAVATVSKTNSIEYDEVKFVKIKLKQEDNPTYSTPPSLLTIPTYFEEIELRKWTT